MLVRRRAERYAHKRECIAGGFGAIGDQGHLLPPAVDHVVEPREFQPVAERPDRAYQVMANAGGDETVDETLVRPKKGDLQILRLGIVWVPT